MERKDVIIAGGGIAGLTAGLHLAKAGARVMLIEKHLYPRHKVCGEYLSREVLPYLTSLDVAIDALEPHAIDRFSLSSASGKSVRCRLPLGGLGISRFAFDKLLYDTAVAAGCEIVHATVTDISPAADETTLMTTNGEYIGKVILGACGKRSQLDAKLRRDFFRKRSPWLAFKTHFDVPFPEHEVALYHFAGGYAGLSRNENGAVNFCCLTHSRPGDGNTAALMEKVIGSNKRLKEILGKAEPLFDPVFISQVSFAPKPPVENHVMMTGDMAGVIHPLCGNGMAMAVHSAKLASENLLSFLSGHISRPLMESRYAAQWARAFSSRLWAGRQLASVLSHQKITGAVLSSLTHMPPVLRGIVRTTHGKPITA